MLEGYGPVVQSLLGSLLTWGLTAAGAALVYFIEGTQVRQVMWQFSCHHDDNIKVFIPTFLN